MSEPAARSTSQQRLDALLTGALLLDLETGPDGAIHKIGAVHAGQEFRREGRFDLDRALADLTRFAGDADLIIGHNLLGHDLPTLRARAPMLALLRRPIADTLYLSPLAFPQNPYHRLVKDYKLVRDSVADPVADCHLAALVLHDQFDALVRRVGQGERDLIGVFRFCFQGALGLADNPTGGDGIARVLALAAPGLPAVAELRATLLARWRGRACTSAAPRLIVDHLADIERRPVLAYAAAWIEVAGGNSVLPPWVRHRFPRTRDLLDALREVPCDDPGCAWCRETHDPDGQLRRWFGFPGFRAEPAAADGGSLQRAIVTDGIAARPLLALLPTGGGKSLCFQLPALVRHQRRGTLTVVVSPLQALMKDQVDNLARKTGSLAAAALFGLLTPPERGDVMERVRLGDVALLYLSPEQLRNRSVAEVLASREIGCWVFDEAHCLSKWGHDFRPDYLYAGRFIRTLADRQKAAIPPVACFTATAKSDVTAEILAYFRDELGLALTLFQGGVERDNLAFEVQFARAQDKDARIGAILREHLGEPTAPRGAAIVYAATRRRTEQLAMGLLRDGWTVEPFHAGLEAPVKKQVLEGFVDGSLAVICATNAFGMGVDKEDVRLVIHADIPGSLENYIQEAGRAGRDRNPALCVLLYDEQDIEAQFGLAARSELTRRDIAEILRGLRRARRDASGAVVVTSGELLRDDDLKLGFDAEERDADTRVRIAIAWLERAGLVRRDENRTGVFQGRPAMASLAAAEKRIDDLGLSAEQRARWLALLDTMLNADPDQGLTADDLARLAVFRGTDGAAPPPWDRGETPAQRVLRTLHDMANAGLLREGPQLTAFVRHKVKDHSMLVLERVARLERAMLATLREQAPDAANGEWLPLAMRRLNQHLLDEGHTDSRPETLRDLLDGLARDGRGLAGSRASLDIRATDRDHCRLRLHRDWPALVETAERRREVAALVLRVLLAKLPTDAPASAELLVAFGTDELTAAIGADPFLAGAVRDPLAAVERGLLFLHAHGAIALQSGFAVFRSAMTVHLLPEAKGRRYSQAQHQPLAQHYGERVFQIHVMNEYARLGAERIRQALGLVSGYFSLGKEAFVRRWFADRREMLARATTAESFARIVDALRNPTQIEIVAAPEEGNRLVLAGPGAGKTRVIVHRCAYLLRVQRVAAARLLVLCFNHAAAVEVRRRLAALVGDDARGITVLTYHGFAMRVTGQSWAERIAAGGETGTDLDAVIADAADLLEGRVDVPGIAGDAMRERLLAGYRHILVDEYQDIDAAQYRLVAAVADRAREEAAPTLLAVGDDDQNVYAFRGASIEHIRRFEADYGASLYGLTENYRSSKHIIAAANALIGHNRQRMKTDLPIRIDQRRRDLPAGGEWERLDPTVRGRVLVLAAADAPRQAQALVLRLLELKRLGGGGWGDFAVLARSHDGLAPVRAVCEHMGVPVTRAGELPPLTRVREVAAFLDALAALGREALVASDLDTLLPTGTDPWSGLVRSLVAAWRAEAGSGAVPAAEIAEFCWESLAQQRRERQAGTGVLLSTLHGAKGLEFRHVLIVDGGWPRDGDGHGDVEDERRVFYVGMTRARETLTLGRLDGARHPHLSLLDGDWLFELRPEVTPPPDQVIRRRFTVLTPADLDLGFAGRLPADAPIHAHLAALRPGDRLGWRVDGPHVLLLDAAGATPVARLSQRAAAHWLPRLAAVEELRVDALLRRDRDQTAPAFLPQCRVARWEVPLVEVRWQAPC